MQLTNWSLIKVPLKGDMLTVIYGLRSDGKWVRTSPIAAVDGNQVQTESGSTYTLGEPNNSYVQWCKENGEHVPTPEEPIKYDRHTGTAQ